MGKKKITTIDDSQAPKAKKEMFKWEEAYSDLSNKTAEALREARLKPDQVMSMADGELLAVEGLDSNSLEEVRAHYPAAIVTEKPQKESTIEPAQKKTSTRPSSRYPRTLVGRSTTYKTKKDLLKVDIYPLSTAVRMLREVSYSAHKTIELHLNTREDSLRGEVTLPHSTGKQTKIAIWNEKTEGLIKAGKLDFDILLAKPEDMPKIAPLAKVLGPKGLMPNPKTNTVVPDPEKRKGELEKGATLSYRSVPKQKVIHLTVGSLNQKDKEVIENLQAIIEGIGLTKIASAYLKSTMSPSVKIDLTKLD